MDPLTIGALAIGAFFLLSGGKKKAAPVRQVPTTAQRVIGQGYTFAQTILGQKSANAAGQPVGLANPEQTAALAAGAIIGAGSALEKALATPSAPAPVFKSAYSDATPMWVAKAADPSDAQAAYDNGLSQDDYNALIADPNTATAGVDASPADETAGLDALAGSDLA